MDPRRWSRVLELFDAARQRPAAEHEAYLASVGDEEDLLAEVRSLLASDAAMASETVARGFLEEPFVRLVEQVNEEEAVPGQRFGPYALDRRLGRGGMGSVWLATRADGAYSAQVAVKLLRRDVGSGELVRRFEAERQILAGLKHPNIAGLLDGGTDAGGRPYLVMEFVEGEAIDHHCDRQRSTLEARLKLFVGVCRAVHFAHQSLVVHRDLKPGNILVTEEGEPKLLDFGVAKLLGDPRGIQVDVTGPLPAPITVAYASPEQLANQPITTASDVYALGTVLYELLVGEGPFAAADGSPVDLIRAVCEQEPPPPSQASAKVESVERGERAAKRQLAPGRWSQKLRSDLDSIVLKALRKEPHQRYASVAALAGDVERHLDGLPVQACEGTLAYRAGKFVRRHRLAVAIAALVAAAALAFTARLTVQQQRLQRERVRTAAVNRFLENILTRSDPEQARGREVTVRELLEEAARGIEGELTGEPELRAQQMMTIGRVYTKLGQFETAEPFLTQAVELLGPASEPRQRAEALELLAEQRVFVGQFEASRQAYEQALALIRDGGRGNEDLVEQGFSGLAQVLSRQGEYEASLEVLEQALAMAREQHGEDHRRVAYNLSALGSLQRRLGRHEVASAAFDQSLAIYRRLYGEDHPEIARVLNNVGFLEQELGRFDQAEERFLAAAAIHRQLYRDPHPNLAATLHNLAALQLAAGRLEAAERSGAEALALRTAVYGHDHPKVAETLDLQGLLSRAVGDLEAAEALHRRALRMFLAALGEEHPFVAASRQNLGVCLRQAGQPEAAEALFRQALAGYRAAVGDGHPEIINLLNSLGLLRKRRGDLAEAENFYRQALAIIEQRFGVEHPKTAGALHNLAVLVRDAGDPAASEVLFQRALRLFRQIFGNEHRNTGLCRKNLAGALFDLGRFEEAASEVETTLNIYGEDLPPDHLWRLQASRLLGEIRTAQKRFEEAESLLQESYARSLEARGQDAEETRKAAAGLQALRDARK